MEVVISLKLEDTVRKEGFVEKGTAVPDFLEI